MLHTDILGKEQVRPSPFASLAAAAVVAVMAFGVWQITAAMRHPGGLEYPRTWLDFREGRTTGTLEKQLDHHLPSRTALITIANSLRFVLTGGGGEQVRIGKNDWLFLTDELRFDMDGATPLDIRAKMLGSAARQLDKYGVKLIVALVPDKARLYGINLPNGHYPAYNEARYTDVMTAFKKYDVTAVDLFKPLALGSVHNEVYYKSDTHWNQAGAKIAAEAIASAVTKVAGDIEKTTYNTSLASEKKERSGDLIRLMSLEGIPPLLRPHTDMEATAATVQTSADSATGLLGDATVPIVLTGTSYSMRGNFHGYLQQALQAKVLNTAKDGGGLLEATTAYLKDEAFQASKPKVLVWEIPERFMLAKLDGEPKWLAKVGFAP